jgi:hypothetical protein
MVLGFGITGASSVEQLDENPRLTPGIIKGIDDAFGIKKGEEEDQVNWPSRVLLG